MWSGTDGWGKEPHSTASHQNLLTGSISSNATPANSIALSASIALYVWKWSRRWCKEKEMWHASWGIRDILFIAGTRFPDDPCQILLSWTRREVKVRSTLSCHPKIMWTQDATKTHLRPQFNCDKVRLWRNFVDAQKCIWMTSAYFAISFYNGVYWSLLALKQLTFRMLWRRRPVKQMSCLICNPLKHGFILSDFWLKHWWVPQWRSFFLWKGKFCVKNSLSAVIDVSFECRMFVTWQLLRVNEWTHWIFKHS